jgi:hypothetical protein
LNDQTHDETRRLVFSILTTVSTPPLLEAASVQVWPADTIVWAMLCFSEAGYMVPQSGPVRRQSY